MISIFINYFAKEYSEGCQIFLDDSGDGLVIKNLKSIECFMMSKMQHGILERHSKYFQAAERNIGRTKKGVRNSQG